MPIIALALATLAPTAQAQAAPSCPVVTLNGGVPEIHFECVPLTEPREQALCSIVGLAGTPPQPGINWDCIGTLTGYLDNPEALTDRMCPIVGLSGIPPQVGINRDCLGVLGELHIFH